MFDFITTLEPHLLSIFKSAHFIVGVFCLSSYGSAIRRRQTSDKIEMLKCAGIYLLIWLLWFIQSCFVIKFNIQNIFIIFLLVMCCGAFHHLGAKNVERRLKTKPPEKILIDDDDDE